jgi:hypothetical protein
MALMIYIFAKCASTRLLCFMKKLRGEHQVSEWSKSTVPGEAPRELR